MQLSSFLCVSHALPIADIKSFYRAAPDNEMKIHQGVAQDSYVCEKKNSLGSLVPHLAKKSPELYVTTNVFHVLATVCRWSLRCGTWLNPTPRPILFLADLFQRYTPICSEVFPLVFFLQVLPPKISFLLLLAFLTVRELEAWWAPELFWTLSRRDKFSFVCH
jgi:hypothetical protein